MKKLCVALFSLLLLTSSACSVRWWTKPQLPPEIAQAFGIQLVHQLPPLELSTQDIIRIISNYNVHQENGKIFCAQYLGMTSAALKEIDVCDDVDQAIKEETMLHELYHVRYGEIGIDTGGPYEPQIEALAQARFHELFGPATQNTIPSLGSTEPKVN